MNRGRLLIACATALSLAACETARPAVPSTTNGPISATAPRNNAPELYVAECCGVLNHGGVKLYDAGSLKVLRRITKFAGFPLAIAVDRSGTLYVLNGSSVGPGAVSVSEFDHGQTELSRRVGYFSWATAIALDDFDRLYVANCNTCVDSGDATTKPHDSVTVYGAHSKTLVQTITQGVHRPVALAFDAAGNLYVVNAGVYRVHPATITAYAPNSVSVLRTIRNGLKGPTRLVFDSSADLFVAQTNSVVEYAAGSTRPVRRIVDGIASPTALLVDGAGTLYVANTANYVNGWVSVYAAGTSRPQYKIARRISDPTSLVLDVNGNLYVSSSGSTCCQGWTSVYGADSTKPSSWVRSGVLGPPQALAFGPR